MKRLDALVLVLLGLLVIAGLGLILFADASAKQLVLALLVAILPSWVAIWLPGLRLAVLAGPPVTQLHGYWANALSVCLYLVLPGRLSEGAKPLILNMEAGLPLARGLAATAIERILDIAMVVGLAGLLFLAGAYNNKNTQSIDVTYLSIALVVGFLSIGLLAWRGPRLFAKSQNRFAKTLRKIIEDSLVIIDGLRSFRTLVCLFTITGGIWLSSYLVTLAILELAGSISLSPWNILLVFLAGIIGYVVAIAPGGIGTFEAATILALNSLGYGVSEAFFLAVLLRFTNVAPAMIAGAIYLRMRSLKIRLIIDRLRNRSSDRSSRTRNL